MRKAALWMLLAVLLLALSGCAALDGLSQSNALPDLRLLSQPPYEEQPPAETPEQTPSALRLDLWLDASQVMGGVNPNEQSMYPHASRRYREGGFHYRYENTVGMYETVLRCMLSSAEGSRVRLLRYGNERLPDEYLLDRVAPGASAQELCSIRRDMLTCAIDPMPSVFQLFSGEKMTDSFYSLGSPWLNRMADLNARLLENPGLHSVMSEALNQQIHAIARGYDDTLLAVGDDGDYPLLYALANLDLSRLSVITCDPAAIRRLSLVDENGQAHALVQELLNSRGVFDAGLSVGLYAFTLDYMGQLSTFAAADLSEPLLWGRLDYNSYTGLTDGVLAMPRTLLALVIGQPAQVDAFTAAFEARLDASDTLKVPRGPQNGQLVYARGGQTIVQEPFGFDYHYLLITRAGVQPITQYTQGVQLLAENAQVNVSGSLRTVTLAPENGAQPDRTLTLQLPLQRTCDGITMNAEKLANVELTVQNALLLDSVLPNRPGTAVPEGAQAIVLRDKIYVFGHQTAQSPVRVTGLSVSGEKLTVRLSVEGGALRPGYYRLLLSAELPGESFDWQTPAWVGALNASITNEHISAWKAFTQVLTTYERQRDFISKPFQHAWGDAGNTSYYGAIVPDFPPVELAPGLLELVSQLQGAARPGQQPYLRFVFDLFVTNQP
ncbi:MAG: hypothetical protein PUD63_08820 [Clostridia bacterium]|nr:hypothetical protein [Clostridia bacterium]